MWIWNGAGLLMALVFLAESPVASDLERGFRASTKFGFAHVDSESAPAAIEEGEAAHFMAKSVLRLPNVRFSIVDVDYTSSSWGSLSADGTPIYTWPFRKGSDDRTLPPPAHLLRHEIGHDLFIRYLVPSTNDKQYGGDAPDWLDEMAAVAFEGEAQRKARRCLAVRYAKEGKLLSLRRFLNMNHPELEAGSIPATSGRQVRAFEAVSNETAQFYAMASAFYDFLVLKTKNIGIVADLATVVQSGGSLDRWILARIGNRDQAPDVETLNADFLVWIVSDEDYGNGCSHRGS
jgi:hypothetical protein